MQYYITLWLLCRVIIFILPCFVVLDNEYYSSTLNEMLSLKSWTRSNTQLICPIQHMFYATHASLITSKWTFGLVFPNTLVKNNLRIIWQVSMHLQYWRTPVDMWCNLLNCRTECSLVTIVGNCQFLVWLASLEEHKP